MTILVTGTSGFIGYHSAMALLKDGHKVIGVDNLNDYYDPGLKRARLTFLSAYDGFRFVETDISHDNPFANDIAFDEVEYILHLAAQAGVRYSLINPHSYVQTNSVGHLNVLEFARQSTRLKHLVYASSSSVYGERSEGPFKETDEVRNPASLYAATKLGGEMMAQSYAHLYGIPQTGLRFFTVYGPWGRPDMAYWIFTQKILNTEPIHIFSAGEMIRDFTYIDDIVAGLKSILFSRVKDGEHEVVNLGNSTPTPLMDLVTCLEEACGREAQKIFEDKQAGDVTHTFADITKARTLYGYEPRTKIQDGLPKFVNWYRDYFKF